MPEDKMPTIISVDELAEKTAKKLEEKMKPAPKPDSLTEPTEPQSNYKEKLVEMVKDTNSNWRWTGPQDNKFFESIDAVIATSAVPEIWASDVFRCCPYPASPFWEAPYIKWHPDILGKPGDIVNVITVGKAYCGTLGCEEPEGTAATIGKVPIELEEYQCSHYICRDDLEDVVEDTITELNEGLMNCLLHCVDTAFITNIEGHGSTLTKGTAVMSPEIIAEAIGSMRTGTCEPVTVIAHPVIEATLMQNAQFTNAAAFGDRSVITGGHIIQYLGLEIHVIPNEALKVNAGTYQTLMLSRYAVHAAKKRDMILEQQYVLKDQKKYFLASVRFGKDVVCDDGVLWIYTAK